MAHAFLEDLFKQEDQKLRDILQDLNRSSTSLKASVLDQIKTYFYSVLATFHQERSDYDLNITLAPSGVDYDLCLDVFSLGRVFKTNPIQLCQNIENYFLKESDQTMIVRCQAEKGYFNFSLDQARYYALILESVLHLSDRYGDRHEDKDKVCVIDYSGPNIAKPIGVGHLRSTIIGQSLANIYESMGYTVLKINHLGDWGTQFGALIYAYEHWFDQAAFDQDPIEALKLLYVRFHQAKEDDPSLADEARQRFQALESGQKEAVQLWETFRQLSIEAFQIIYDQFGISFDAYLGESVFAGHTQAVIDEVLEKQLCRGDDKGTALLVVDQLKKVPSFLLRKQDGSSLYLTRDLAALKYRYQSFSPDTVLYVVGQEQSLHFKQLFSLFQAMGHDVDTLAHVGFGLVLTDGKKMSTRKGSLVTLSSLLDQAREKIRVILAEKQTDLDNQGIDTLAVGAIIYNDLSRSRQKDIEFNWEQMLSMDGGSAVYLQYTYARIRSILRRFEARFNALSVTCDADYSSSIDFKLGLKLMVFETVISSAKNHQTPHLIATYLEELAQQFNSFYAKCSVKDSEDALFLSRYDLLQSVSIVLKKGLRLLNIGVLERI